MSCPANNSWSVSSPSSNTWCYRASRRRPFAVTSITSGCWAEKSSATFTTTRLCESSPPIASYQTRSTRAAVWRRSAHLQRLRRPAAFLQLHLPQTPPLPQSSFNLTCNSPTDSPDEPFCLARDSTIDGEAYRLTRRTVGCGPACPVVWEGRSREVSPYPDPGSPGSRWKLPLALELPYRLRNRSRIRGGGYENRVRARRERRERKGPR